MTFNPFLNPDPARVFLETELVIGLWDAFPISPGHALLVPRRVVPTWFEATPEEQQALTRAIELARLEIEKTHKPDGYNIGINAGAAAGQTVFHLHVHVIPRYEGDVPDPRGGVRYVIPGKANYLEGEGLVKESVAPEYGAGGSLSTGQENPLLPKLLKDLARAQSVDMAVSFLQPSGLDELEEHLLDLLIQRRGSCRLVTGDYLDITHPDALERLLGFAHDPEVGNRLQIRVFEYGKAKVGFHPKAYLFTNQRGRKTAYVGSSNLSKSALTEAVEWNYRFQETLDPRGLAQVEGSFEALFNGEHSEPLTYEWLAGYRKRRRPLPTKMDVLDDDWQPPAEPHPIQQEALDALRVTRELGNRAGRRRQIQPTERWCTGL
jgi:diadenosine tetraphosphate (Ap4A) HIT family hydrolase/HKD family nuclease